MTAQELFDRAVKHLRGQLDGVTPGRCVRFDEETETWFSVYGTRNGKRDPVGLFIPRDHPAMWRFDITPSKLYAAFPSLPDLFREHGELLEELARAHDVGFNRHGWSKDGDEVLRWIAKRYNLTVPRY